MTVHHPTKFVACRDDLECGPSAHNLKRDGEQANGLNDQIEDATRRDTNLRSEEDTAMNMGTTFELNQELDATNTDLKAAPA